MPGALFPRLKTWVSTEDVVYSDLNAEFDNILNNLVPLMIDDYSLNTAQMQVTTDPGEVGSESLATTLGGELARLRHMIKEITGKTHWYQTPSDSLAGIASVLGTSTAPNRLVSGKVRSTSEQPIFLVPHGAARTVTLKGSATNFLYYIEGTQYTISSDVTLTSLTAAPSTNNTCLVNDANAADQDWTKYSGEDGTEITIDTVGSEITALVGKFAAFKLDNGSATEYFLAKVETDKLTRAYRGFFFDSSDNPKPRIVYSNNDTITLLKLSWIFAKTDGTLTVSYTNPVWQEEEPTSPSSGDFWYDLENEKWMRYDLSVFIDADATLVGVCVQDTSNTIGARSFEFFKSWSDLNTVEVAFNTNAQVQSRNQNCQISVWGEAFRNERNQFTWDMTVHLDSGLTEASSTYYFFYITEDGSLKISDIRPYNRREDLQGYYHPHESWRCVGNAFNNSSSNLTAVNSYFSRYDAVAIAPPHTAASNIQIIDKMVPIDGSGSAFTEILPPLSSWKGSAITFYRKDQTLANHVTLDFYASEEILHATATKTTYKLCTKGETVTFRSDGTNAIMVAQYIPAAWSTPTTTTITGSTSDPTKGTIVKDAIKWIRLGKFARFEVKYSQTSGGAAGSGAYLLLLPDSLVADVTEETGVLVNATATSPGAIALGNLPGHVQMQNNSTWAGHEAILHSSTQVKFAGYGSATGIQVWGSAATSFNLSVNPVVVGGWFDVPIAGWEG